MTNFALWLLRAGIASAILTHANHQFNVYLTLILALILLLKTLLTVSKEPYPKIVDFLSYALLFAFFIKCLLDKNGDIKTFEHIGDVFEILSEVFAFWALDVLFDEFMNVVILKRKKKSDSWLYKFVENFMEKFSTIEKPNSKETLGISSKQRLKR